MIQFKEVVSGTEIHKVLVMDEWRTVLEYQNHPKTTKARKAYKKKVDAFFDWFIDYANTILPKKPYKIQTILPILLPLEPIHSTTNLISHYRYRLYLIREYILHIKTVLTHSNVDRYNNEINALGCEMDLCICAFNGLRDQASIYRTHTGTCYSLKIFDIFSATNELLYIEEATDISDIYLRDLKPNVIFQMRQFIEILGKRIIGYTDIKNPTNGKSIHKFTQIAWEFIESKNNKSNWSIDLPLEQCHITRINKWSNRFVHSGNFTPTYIQVYLHKLLSHLMTPPTSHVTIYNGRKKLCGLFGDIRINNYNNLKSDFQNYIDAKMKGPGRATIEWSPLDDVHAYIISL